MKDLYIRGHDADHKRNRRSYSTIKPGLLKYRYNNASFLQESPRRMTSDDINFKRLRWRSRRGMLELDLLLLPFLEEVYKDLSNQEQQAYAKLLDQDDPDLLQWFSRKSLPADADLRRLVIMILERVQAK